MLGKVIKRLSSETLSQASPFSGYKFPSFVERVLSNKEFIDATDIQKQAWPPILEGRDLVGVAKTGSGKTLTYLLPMISNILKSHNNNLKIPRNHQPTSLVILPTRELAKQVSNEFSFYAYQGGIRFATVFGGEKKYAQKQILTSGIHALIGTPGRIMDFMSDESLSLSNIKYLVIDEADMLFDMGFEQVIRNIIMSISASKQTVMFTATWPKEIAMLASEFLDNPVKIQVGNSELSMNEDIQHKFIFNPPETVNDGLVKLINDHAGSKFLIFMNTKVGVDKLRGSLKNYNIDAESLHSDKTQYERNYAMKIFTSGGVRILIATDVVSRGIDIKNIDFVVNYDIPTHIDDYIHRCGRTGRAGKKGTAITFYHYGSKRVVMKAVEKKLKEIKQIVPSEFREIANRDN